MHIFALNKINGCMELFKGQNLIEFAERFNSEESCLEYLAHVKWSKGFLCVKCGHSASQTRRIIQGLAINAVTLNQPQQIHCFIK